MTTDLASLSDRFNAVCSEIAAMEAVLASVRNMGTPWANAVRMATIPALESSQVERRELRTAMNRQLDTLFDAKPLKVGK